MDLNVRRSDLLRELHLFQGIVERKNTIPILANVLFEATDDDSLKLLATDLEVGLRCCCPAKVSKTGSLTIPAKKIYEIVRALPETEIQIRQGPKGSVEISADEFKSRMQTLPFEDFPKLAKPGEGLRRLLPREALREMVTKTQFAITGEDTRFFLNGALFVLSAEQMRLVATDGHRLALVSALRKSEKKDEEETSVILPKKTLLELARLLADGDGDVQYESTENHLFFEVNGRQLISRMIDAKFPSYERVIPEGNDKNIEFERDRLMSAIKRVAVLSSERSRAVKFLIDKEKVEVVSNSPEVGEAKEVLFVDYTGPKLEICFNAQYVLDFLGVTEAGGINLEFKDEKSQAVLRPGSTDGCDYTYVIMPMRV